MRLKAFIEKFGDQYIPGLPSVLESTTGEKVQRLSNESFRLRQKIVDNAGGDEALTMAWQDERARLYQKARKMAGLPEEK